MLCLGGGKSCHGGLPVTHVANRGVEGVAQCSLLGQPLGMVAGWAAACDDFKAFFVETLTNGGTDATHTARDVCNFLTHFVSSFPSLLV